MRNQHLTPAYGKLVHRRKPMHPLISHAVSGMALALLFVGVLYSVDSTMARLLSEVGGLSVIGALFLLHAGLFTCASLATAIGGTVGCGGSAAVASHELRLAHQSVRRRRSAPAG